MRCAAGQALLSIIAGCAVRSGGLLMCRLTRQPQHSQVMVPIPGLWALWGEIPVPSAGPCWWLSLSGPARAERRVAARRGLQGSQPTSRLFRGVVEGMLSMWPVYNSARSQQPHLSGPSGHSCLLLHTELPATVQRWGDLLHHCDNWRGALWPREGGVRQESLQSSSLQPLIAADLTPK